MDDKSSPGTVLKTKRKLESLRRAHRWISAGCAGQDKDSKAKPGAAAASGAAELAAISDQIVTFEITSGKVWLQ